MPADPQPTLATATFHDDVAAQLAGPGYARVPAPVFRAALLAAEPDTLREWDSFAASWERLALDPYMGDGGRYRYRRHAVYAAAPGQRPILTARTAHYQSRDYNSLNGGIERWFEPIEDPTTHSAPLRAILAVSHAVCARLRPQVSWHVEVHQFRIVASVSAAGRPTPEGVHRDGVDYVLVMMVRRENIASGVTDLYDTDGAPVASFTLVDTASAVMLDDHRLAHGVTPVEPLHAGAPSYRDVLVVTYRDAGRLPPAG